MTHPLKAFPLVYLGTPYSLYPGGIEAAFRDAALLTGRLLAEGILAFSPIVHSHPIAKHCDDLDALDHDFWMEADAAFMEVAACLAVAMLDDWENSCGLRHEIDAFRKAGKPVFLLDPETLEVEPHAGW